jgi:hypothetical protein
LLPAALPEILTSLLSPRFWKMKTVKSSSDAAAVSAEIQLSLQWLFGVI